MLSSLLPASLLLAGTFAASMFPSHRPLSPAAIIVTTQAATDEAFRLGDKLADRGIIVLVRRYDSDTYSPARHRELIGSTRYAFDSLARRTDIDPTRIGLITISQASAIAPSFVRDSTLAFVVAVHAQQADAPDTLYAAASIPTLILKPHVADALSAQSTITSEVRGKLVTLFERAGDNTVIWSLTQSELATLSRPMFPLAERVAEWVAAHVKTPSSPVLETMVIRAP